MKGPKTDYSCSKHYILTTLVTHNACLLETLMKHSAICPCIRVIKTGSEFFGKYPGSNWISRQYYGNIGIFAKHFHIIVNIAPILPQNQKQ